MADGLAQFASAVSAEHLRVARDKAVVLSCVKKRAALQHSLSALGKHAALCRQSLRALRRQCTLHASVCGALQGPVHDEDGKRVVGGTVQRSERVGAHGARLAMALAVADVDGAGAADTSALASWYQCLSDVWIESEKQAAVAAPVEDVPLVASVVSEVPTSTGPLPLYDVANSPLTMLRAFRFHPGCASSASARSPFSLAVSHKLDPFLSLCRADLASTCTAKHCRFQHCWQYVPSLDDLAAFTLAVADALGVRGGEDVFALPGVPAVHRSGGDTSSASHSDVDDVSGGERGSTSGDESAGDSESPSRSDSAASSGEREGSPASRQASLNELVVLVDRIRVAIGSLPPTDAAAFLCSRWEWLWGGQKAAADSTDAHGLHPPVRASADAAEHGLGAVPWNVRSWSLFFRVHCEDGDAACQGVVGTVFPVLRRLATQAKRHRGTGNAGGTERATRSTTPTVEWCSSRSPSPSQPVGSTGADSSSCSDTGDASSLSPRDEPPVYVSDSSGSDGSTVEPLPAGLSAGDHVRAVVAQHGSHKRRREQGIPGPLPDQLSVGVEEDRTRVASQLPVHPYFLAAAAELPTHPTLSGGGAHPFAAVIDVSKLVWLAVCYVTEGKPGAVDTRRSVGAPHRSRSGTGSPWAASLRRAVAWFASVDDASSAAHARCHRAVAMLHKADEVLEDRCVGAPAAASRMLVQSREAILLLRNRLVVAHNPTDYSATLADALRYERFLSVPPARLFVSAVV